MKLHQTKLWVIAVLGLAISNTAHALDNNHFQVEYSANSPSSSTGSNDYRGVFEEALRLWGELLVIKEPIHVYVQWENINAYGEASTTSFFPITPIESIQYPAAWMAQVQPNNDVGGKRYRRKWHLGKRPENDRGEYHIGITLDSNPMYPWYVAKSGHVPSGEKDFLSTAGRLGCE